MPIVTVLTGVFLCAFINKFIKRGCNILITCYSYIHRKKQGESLNNIKGVLYHEWTNKDFCRIK